MVREGTGFPATCPYYTSFQYSSIMVVKVNSNETGIMKVSIGEPFEYLRTNFTGDHEIDVKSLKDSGIEIEISKENTEISIPLDPSDHILGLGEKALPVDRKRTKSVLWNSDSYGYSIYSDPLYCSIPFFIKITSGGSYGYFINYPGRITVDCGISRYNKILIQSLSQSLAFYIIRGKSPEEIVEKYSGLTGKPFLIPKWALEHQISRYSYYPDNIIISMLKRYRDEFGVNSVGSIYLDIDYMDDYKLFTIDKMKFPDIKEFLKSVHEMGVKVIPILDPGIKAEQGYQQFHQGMGSYVETMKNEIYTGGVWPGKCVFPDFFSEEGKSFWKKEVEKFMENGFDGIWLDMNEPAVQDEKSGTFPEDLIHSAGGIKMKHRELHNAYALAEAEATSSALGKNKFILSRAGYSGIQKYAAIWSGDGTSSFESMALQIPVLTGLSISGVPYVGCDLGGFLGYSSPELLLRFYQMALLFPIYRNHKSNTGNDQELYIYPDDIKQKFRQILSLRHALVPYLHWKSVKAVEKGTPIIRPLAFNFPDIESLFTINDEYMAGKELLLAPIVNSNTEERFITFPPGKWYSFEHGKVYEGNSTTKYSGDIPLFQSKDTCIIAGERLCIFGDVNERVFFKGKWINVTVRSDSVIIDGNKAPENEYIIIDRGRVINFGDLVQ